MDTEKITVLCNFRVPPVLEKAIREDSAELGLNTSEFLRLCVYMASPLLQACPTLTSLNRLQLAELMSDVGKILVVQPSAVTFEVKI